MTKLKQLRLERGFTQEWVWWHTGIPQSAISKIERRVPCNYDTQLEKVMRKLAKFFDWQGDPMQLLEEV